MVSRTGVDDRRAGALEDCRHVSVALERFLLASGEQVVRVPPRLMAGARRSGRRRGKSDAIDALAVARAALRERELQVARLAGPEREIRLLVDHRDDLVGERTRIQQRLRWQLHELCPELELPAGCLDRRVWLTRLGRRTAGLERFRGEAQLAMHAGAAPLPASSGNRRRHRLNRSGNRQLNRALHRIAVTQGRWHPPAREYLARQQGEGKSRKEALRCLKRHLARVAYRTLTRIEQDRITSTERPALVPDEGRARARGGARPRHRHEPRRRPQRQRRRLPGDLAQLVRGQRLRRLRHSPRARRT